jgi:protein TonB
MLRALHAPPVAAPVATAPALAPAAPMRSVEVPAVAATTPPPAALESEPAPAAFKPERIALASASPLRPQPLAASVGNLAVSEKPELQLALAAPASSALAKTRVAPTFPQHARIAGIEGRVTLSFVVDASGQAREIRVLEATPVGEFETAAMTALREWRFNHSATSPGQRYSQVFDFSLADQVPAETEADCRYALGSHICRHDLPAVDVEGAVTETTPASAR